MIENASNLATRMAQRAIVIGAGISGIAAARVLSEFCQEVVVLERDELPNGPVSRPGVPQGRHPHGLLAGSIVALNELFPGFAQDLANAGAVPLDPGSDVLYEMPGMPVLPQRPWRWHSYAMSRPLFEHCLFTHLRRYPNIKVRRQHHVLEITGSPYGSRVTGVRYATAAGNAALSAEIVVDASGHGSFTTGFLQASGWPLPVEEVVGVDIRYSSTMFAAPEPLTNYKGLISFPKAPEHVRYGYLLPAENNCWQVLMVGRGDDVPPVEGNAFLDFARQLETPSIYNAIRDAERVSDIARYGFPESSWKHFGQLGSFPEGLLPFGDAICRFNPIWGQGMTVALQEGQLLRHLLQGADLGGHPLAALSQTFVERAEVLIADPWTMATLPDFVYPATRGERPRDLRDRLRFQRVLHHLAVSDPDIHKLMFEVRHLLKPSAALRQPEIMRLVEPELARA